MPLKKQPAPKNSRIWFLFRKALKNDSFHFPSKKERAFIHGSFIREQIKTARVIFFACDVLMSFLNLQGNGEKNRLDLARLDDFQLCRLSADNNRIVCLELK